MNSLPYVPHELPIQDLNWERLAPYTSKATLALARYDGTLDGIVNPAVLLSPITSREAVLSSQIEGTQATLVEVLGHEAGQDFDEVKRGEIKEVINYRQALLTGENYLKERPITLSLVRELHAMLMKEVRGNDKDTGQFRHEQNWIGKKGATIEQARFVPPSPLIMQEHLEKFQAFLSSDYADPLVQLAVIHAQFEIIHPFKDGNGRLGRMLIPLFLYQKRVLQRPMFYLSEYLEESDQEYRDRLLAITNENDWQGWIEFFLNAIHTLYEQLKPVFRDVTKSQYSQAALDAFFKKPIISSTDFLSLSGMTNRGTANALLKSLLEAEQIIALKAGAGQSPSIYAFPALINITEGKQLFGK